MAGMGHAVMGTAVRSGANRAIEAAQAAMASPLLEAGAIDGARGILINITGSSIAEALRGQRGVLADPVRRPRGRQHHLRRGAGREDGRRGQDHRHRHRLPRPDAGAARAHVERGKRRRWFRFPLWRQADWMTEPETATASSSGTTSAPRFLSEEEDNAGGIMEAAGRVFLLGVGHGSGHRRGSARGNARRA